MKLYEDRIRVSSTQITQTHPKRKVPAWDGEGFASFAAAVLPTAHRDLSLSVKQWYRNIDADRYENPTEDPVPEDDCSEMSR